MTRKTSARNKAYFIRRLEREFAQAVASGMPDSWIQKIARRLAALKEV